MGDILHGLSQIEPHAPSYWQEFSGKILLLFERLQRALEDVKNVSRLREPII